MEERAADLQWRPNGVGLAVPSLIRGRNRGSGQMSLGFFDLAPSATHAVAAPGRWQLACWVQGADMALS